MTPSDAAGSSAIIASRMPLAAVASTAISVSTAPPTSSFESNVAATAHSGKVHAVAVPADEIVGASGRLTEALYRGFEILVAATGRRIAKPVGGAGRRPGAGRAAARGAGG